MEISEFTISNWLKQPRDNRILFDDVLSILSEINEYLDENNLKLIHGDDSILLIQLVKFLYKNSSHFKTEY